MRLPTNPIALAACASLLLFGGLSAQTAAAGKGAAITGPAIMGFNGSGKHPQRNTERELVDKLQTMHPKGNSAQPNIAQPNPITGEGRSRKSVDKPSFGQKFKMGLTR